MRLGYSTCLMVCPGDSCDVKSADLLTSNIIAQGVSQSYLVSVLKGIKPNQIMFAYVIKGLATHA